MMEINRNNYEAYFVDYLEGNLDEKLVDDFIEFLQQNPDLKEELSLFETVTAEAEPISFEKKDKLYKEKFDHEDNFNQTAIAALEGDITLEEEQEFESYLSSHPEKRKDAELFNKTRLKADESVLFNKKNKLYKKSTGKIVLLWASRVAAVVILGLAIFTLVDRTNIQKPTEKIALHKDRTVKKDIVSEEKTSVTKEKAIIPEKKKEKKQEIKKPVTPKASIKKAPAKKESKSIRETTKGRLEKDDIALIRIPVEIPEEMKTITASIDVMRPKASLGTMYLTYPENYYEEEWLLADEIRKTLNFSKVTKAGLNLFASISNNRFTYETNTNGKVTEYNYDSRLLAFSIPNKNAQVE